MTLDNQISFQVFAVLVLIAAMLALALGFGFRRVGVIAASPLKYVPHLVLLLTIAVTPMISAGAPTLLKSLTVLGGVVVIWLVAVWLSSQVPHWLSRKSADTHSS